MLHHTPLNKTHQRYLDAEFKAHGAGNTAATRPGAQTAHQQAAVEFETFGYGPPDEQGGRLAEFVPDFGSVELEYAAIRKGVGLYDDPTRGTISLTGTDRITFLDGMLTQALADMRPGMFRQSFWLNRKGRIDADLAIANTEDRMLIGVDIFRAATTAAALDKYLFAEDVVLEDASDKWHHLALHGPQAGALLKEFEITAPGPGAVTDGSIGGCLVVIVRRDVAGVDGYDVICGFENVAAVWAALLKKAPEHRGRPIGWMALNIARVETGTPYFQIDFGTDNLPHESGVIADRVSFTKGCYLGQEIVARMESLGKPKQVVAALRVESDHLPADEAAVYAAPDDDTTSFGDRVGTVTSSTLSPLLGATPLALAMVKTAHAEIGNTLVIEAEGAFATATVVERPIVLPPVGPKQEAIA